VQTLYPLTCRPNLLYFLLPIVLYPVSSHEVTARSDYLASHSPAWRFQQDREVLIGLLAEGAYIIFVKYRSISLLI
jgi:hypothetical protein